MKIDKLANVCQRCFRLMSKETSALRIRPRTDLCAYLARPRTGAGERRGDTTMRAATSVITSFVLSLLAATAFGGPVAAETTTLRMTWYSDGNEGEVMADLLKRFHEQNKDIEIVLDQVPYKAVNETLPVQLASGQGPDMARIVDMGGLSRFALDMRPFLKDPGYWETNFGPFLEWMRPAGDTKAIPGFMTQLTVTGPFVNKTLDR